MPTGATTAFIAVDGHVDEVRAGLETIVTDDTRFVLQRVR